jgi:lipoate-protein ligase B
MGNATPTETAPVIASNDATAPDRKMNREIEVIRLPGLSRYDEAFQTQHERRAEVEAGRAGNALFLLEHSPVITLGRNHHKENLLYPPEQLRAMGIEVTETDRGGDVTYHGPGQMVAYPIINLSLWDLGIRRYLRVLEETLIQQLAFYGLTAGREEGLTGVWVNGAKAAAIGVGIHNWVTCHGIALNVKPNMEHFGLIVPCGISDKPVTSLEALLGRAPSMTQVMDDFERSFRAQFPA